MYLQRMPLYKALEEEFSSKILVYITSDRRGFETQIAQDVIDFFICHLDKIGTVDQISLYLYTRGGDTAATWNIVNLLRMYCDKLQVIIPHKAHSAGTIISIGANSIVMTKQATLSPIDPSINTPLNPQIPNTPAGNTLPISVEAVKGYIEFAKAELAIKGDMALAQIMSELSHNVHPLVLGQVYRTRAQIKMLAEKLLKNQVRDKAKIKRIISFLCSDSGSHDYTINRREAKDTLGLNVLKPTESQYRLIKSVYDDISTELGFGEVFDARTISGAYTIRRGLLESIDGGSDYFVTEGRCVRINAPNGQQVIQNEKVFEGWRHEDPPTETETQCDADLGTSTEEVTQQEVRYERNDEFGL